MGNNNYHLYQKDRGKNYNYTDRVLKSYLEQGGALFHIYKLLATVDSDGNEYDVSLGQVSDAVLNENPHRKYSREVYDLWGVTKLQAPKWSFLLEGYSELDGDEREIVFHYNSMIAQLGRKIIVGDVVEMSFQRDIDILGSDKAQNKFFQVTESIREDTSWDPTYHFHLWKIKVKPITDSSEFQDLFNYESTEENLGYGEGIDNNAFYEDLGSINGGGGIDPSLSTSDSYLNLNDQILEEADEKGPSFRLHDEHHLYFDLERNLYDENGRFIPDGIDGIAKELNCSDIPYGDTFPNDAEIDSYYLRIDVFPCKLFKREMDEKTKEKKWTLIEVDCREKWTGVPQIARRAINMEGTITNKDGTVTAKKQNIKDLVKARVKKENGNPRPWGQITKIQGNNHTPQGI